MGGGLEKRSAEEKDGWIGSVVWCSGEDSRGRGYPLYVCVGGACTGERQDLVPSVGSTERCQESSAEACVYGLGAVTGWNGLVIYEKQLRRFESIRLRR